MPLELTDRQKTLAEYAGWHEARVVPVPAAVPADHPAAAILAALGGLTLGSTSPGQECARSTVCFVHLEEPDARIASWQRVLDTTLIGIAELDDGHGELYVSADGR
ncbi:MAG: SUKH-3 domain-containing protein, partial [Solimonas sp.]